MWLGQELWYKRHGSKVFSAGTEVEIVTFMTKIDGQEKIGIDHIKIYHVLRSCNSDIVGDNLHYHAVTVVCLQ